MTTWQAGCTPPKRRTSSSWGLIDELRGQLEQIGGQLADTRAQLTSARQEGTELGAARDRLTADLDAERRQHAEQRRRAEMAEQRTSRDEANRLRAQLLEYFPALERAFDFSKSKGALRLLPGFRTPARIREIGEARLRSWLKVHDVQRAAQVAACAIAAGRSQQVALPGEQLASDMARRLALAVMALDVEVAELDTLIEARFRAHRDAEVITSMPGMGASLGAELVALIGGDLAAYGTPDRLAGAAGLAPAPRDPDGSAETRAAPNATTGGCCGSSTCPRRSASSALPPPGSTISANASKGSGTPRRCSPWPAAG